MQEDIVIEVKMKKREFFRYTFYAEYLFTGSFYKLIAVLAVFFGLALLLIFQYRNYTNGSMVLGLVLIIPLFLGWRFFRSVGKDYEEYFSYPKIYRLNEVGMEGESGEGSSFMKWEDMDKIVEYSDCIFVYPNSFFPIFFPKHLLKQEEIDFLLSSEK